MEVGDREFLAIAGPAGCGSAQVLRAIAGLEKAATGEILIADKKVNDLPPRERDVAMIFPTPALYPAMTVGRNLAFGMKGKRFSQKEIERRVSDAASILGLEALMGRRPADLTPVEQFRAALGRAVARQPKVFLFDHALGGFDAATRAELRAQIIRLHQQLQATIIFATTDAREAMTTANVIAVMADGAVQQTGPAGEVYRAPATVLTGGFLGSPGMNFIRGSVKGSGDVLTFKEAQGGIIEFKLGNRAGALGLAGREVLAGIRPEDVEIITGAAPPGGLRFQSLLDIVEPLGGEAIAHIQTGAHTLLSRTRAPLGVEDGGHRVQFGFDPDKVALYDPETRRRLGP